MAKQLDWKYQADVYRLGLTSGYFTKDEVIAWADSVIALESQPSSILLDISLSRALVKSSLISLLGEIKCRTRLPHSFRILLGLYAKRLREENEIGPFLAHHLYTFSSALDWSEITVDEVALNSLTDAYALAQSNAYGTIEEATEAFQTFLEQYEPLANEFLNITDSQKRSANESKT